MNYNSKQPLIGTATLILGLMLAPTSLFAGELTAVAKATGAAKAAESMAEVSRALEFTFSKPRLNETIAKQALAEIKNYDDVYRAEKIRLDNDPASRSMKATSAQNSALAHQILGDIRIPEMVKASHNSAKTILNNDYSIRMLGLSEAELDNLAREILSFANAAIAPEKVVQKFVARRYLLHARSANGAIVTSANLAEPELKILVKRLQFRGIEARYDVSGSFAPPFGAVTVMIKGDDQAIAVLDEFARAETRVARSAANPISDGERLAAAGAAELARMEAQRQELLRQVAELDTLMSDIRVTDRAAKPIEGVDYGLENAVIVSGSGK